MTLLDVAEHFGESVGGDRIMIRQKFRQPDLAAMAVIARENLNRIFADWKRRKLVSLFGAQLGINLNVVSRFIASATYAVIRVILALTGNT